VDGTESITVQLNPVLIAFPLVVAIVFAVLVGRGAIRVRRQAAPPEPIEAVVGTLGTAQTPIAPTGIASAQGEDWTARTTRGPIRPGEALRVIGYDGLELIVEPAGAGAAAHRG
jgi:membrane-bound ClpP family serine protease